MTNLEAKTLPERMRAAITESWLIFSRKVGGGLIPINKEASMQLQFAYILQQMAALITFDKDEFLQVELETGVRLKGLNGEKDENREIDLVFSGRWGKDGQQEHKIAVEMKCYRTIASSGGNRGATDIFMKDVYFDLYLLERYMASGHAQQGVALVMNDMERLVNPAKKTAKCWRYDISQGVRFGAEKFDTPIGGKEINFELEKQYQFAWQKYNKFWFLEAEGQDASVN